MMQITSVCISTFQTDCTLAVTESVFHSRIFSFVHAQQKTWVTKLQRKKFCEPFIISFLRMLKYFTSLTYFS